MPNTPRDPAPVPSMSSLIAPADSLQERVVDAIKDAIVTSLHGKVRCEIPDDAHGRPDPSRARFVPERDLPEGVHVDHYDELVPRGKLPPWTDDVLCMIRSGEAWLDRSTLCERWSVYRYRDDRAVMPRDAHLPLPPLEEAFGPPPALAPTPDPPPAPAPTPDPPRRRDRSRHDPFDRPVAGKLRRGRR